MTVNLAEKYSSKIDERFKLGYFSCQLASQKHLYV